MTSTAKLLGTAAVAFGLAAPAMAETILVTNFEAAGAGSLQAALDAAAASPEASTILVAEAGGTLITETGLRYDGTAPLAIFGNGLRVSSPENVTLFTATQAQDISLAALALVGPGGWSITARGDADGAVPGKGIFVDVAETATGEVVLRLHDVLVAGVAGHGIHVSDCTLADACGGGSGGAGEGSDASIVIEAQNLEIRDAGNGRFDADGLRVDERGAGSIHFTATNLLVHGVGADGIELDEGQAGDVIVDLFGGDFIDNGAYCPPEMLAAYMPAEDEGEFAQGTMAEDAIPGPITGSPDDGCFEREVDLYDDGSVEAYEFGIDVDDGFDIDEAGPGNLIASFTYGEMRGNYDEGYDFDEEGPGDIDVVFTDITGDGNADDAIKLSEEDEGDVYGVFTTVEARDNGGVGIVAEEADDGDVLVVVVSSATGGNDDGELGLEIVQEDAGTGAAYLIDSDIGDGVEVEGLSLTETE